MNLATHLMIQSVNRFDRFIDENTQCLQSSACLGLSVGTIFLTSSCFLRATFPHQPLPYILSTVLASSGSYCLTKVITKESSSLTNSINHLMLINMSYNVLHMASNQIGIQ